MPGPKKKLAVLDYLDGNPSKTRRLVNEACGVDGLGRPFTPTYLAAAKSELMLDAKACVEVIQASMPPQVYKALDSFHLAAFGLAWAVHKRAAEQIGREEFEFV